MRSFEVLRRVLSLRYPIAFRAVRAESFLLKRETIPLAAYGSTGSLLRATRRVLKNSQPTIILLGAMILTIAMNSGKVMAAESNFSPVIGSSNPCVITIKGVYLKNDTGTWVKVIEPDRRVDLSTEEPVVSFFNNGGRVPAGEYQNFRVDFFSAEGGSLPVKKLYSKNDFEKVVMVSKGSFIRVAFDLELKQKMTVERVGLTVDEDSRILLNDSLILEV